jgi:hypothetical protein
MPTLTLDRRRTALIISTLTCLPRRRHAREKKPACCAHPFFLLTSLFLPAKNLHNFVLDLASARHNQNKSHPSHINADSSHAITMAHNLSVHATAHYFHATLEQFDRVAVQEITRRFEGASMAVHIEPGPYTLNYDERDHVFFLTCQSHVGASLNEKLGHIIRDYVAGGATTVKRFAECETEDLFYGDEEQLEEKDAPPLLGSPPPPDIHVVNFDDINPLGRAKAFRVQDLPHALRFRARNRHENLANAITFRRVRWNQSSEEHEFDASVGHELQELSKDEEVDITLLLDILVFSEFTAKIMIPKPHDPEPVSRDFEFVDEEPSVRQWLEGTGSTRQDDPGDEPEMSGDAQRFASGPPVQLNTLGRVRKPLGMTLSELREPETAVQPDRSEEQINDTFAALMRSGADAHSDTEPSETTTDEASIIGSIKPGTIAELVRGASDQSVTEELIQPSDWSAIKNSTDAALARTSAGYGRAGDVLAAGPKLLRPDENFPKYDKSYANVDGVGLCGDAVNQVNWENENATELWTQRNKSTPRTYEALALSRAESVSAARQAGRYLQSKAITSITPMSYAETPLGGDEPWANNVVQPTITVSTGTLIDTNESVNGEGRPKTPLFPPGLFPPLGSSGKHQRKETKASAVQMGNFSTRANSKAKIAQDMQPISHSGSKREEEEELLMRFDDDDLPPIERVKPQQENSPRLFHTMRQQAQKNKHLKKKPKTSTTNAATPRPATLELPSPPPAPKPQRENKSAGFQKQRSDVPPTDPAPLIFLQQAIASLLKSSPRGAGEADVVVQFGLALMTRAEGLTATKALRCAELQDVLDRRSTQRCHTTFLTAIGRKDKDGVYLLRLPVTLPGIESPYAGSSQLVSAWTDGEKYGIVDRRIYEITIVAPSGHEWMLAFDQESPQDVQITLANVHQQSVYVHYPQRVWDARVRLLPAAGPEPESALKSKIMTFLNTFNTPKATEGNPRPFFDATIPDAAFRIVSVLAKRVLTTTLRSGTWRVTQACDLHLDSTRGSVKAFAKKEGLMELEGRIWWEAALQYDGGEDFGNTMNEIMERLDNVGNPEGGAETEKATKTKENEHIPFW